jgi:hypothetical protein
MKNGRIWNDGEKAFVNDLIALFLKHGVEIVTCTDGKVLDSIDDAIRLPLAEVIDNITAVDAVTRGRSTFHCQKSVAEFCSRNRKDAQR